jgi:cobalt-zinc-cadmium efflux system protein
MRDKHDKHDKEHAGHSHGHVNVREQNRSALLIVLALTSCYMLVEVVIGFYSHSLALLADAGHMLSDVGAIVLALVAYWFSSKPATAGKTFGYYRSEILAGFFNSLILVMISIYIIFEAYHRLQSPPTVSGLPVLLTAAFGFIINIASLKLLHKGAQGSINAKAAYLEVLSDSLATFGVICSSLLILFTKWYAADAIVSAIIGIGILPRTWLLLTECINILMEGTPAHINVADMRQAMMSVEGVLDVHDVHVWTITSGLEAMSSHVAIDERSRAEAVLTEVTRVLNEKYSIQHTTIQVEQVECKDKGKESCGEWAAEKP